MMHWELISWSVQMLKKVENMLVRNSWKNWDALAGKRGSREESKPATVICMAMLCYAKSLQSCPTLCDPIDGSPPGFPVPGILQARTLEWVAISFSNAWKWKWSRSVVSNPQRPHGLQPSRLLHPWDFPGTSTGVGCHCLLPDGEVQIRCLLRHKEMIITAT